MHKWGVGRERKWIELADNRHMVSLLHIPEEILDFIS